MTKFVSYVPGRGHLEPIQPFPNVEVAVAEGVPVQGGDLQHPGTAGCLTRFCHRQRIRRTAGSCIFQWQRISLTVCFANGKEWDHGSATPPRNLAR